MRLNGWQRIGVALSLIWAVLVCGYAAYEYAQRGAETQVLIQVTPDKAPVVDKRGSVVDYIEFRSGEPSLLWGRLLVAVVAPLVVAWIIAYLCVFTVRWVIAGFKKNGT
jgi:hypothetical protein